LLSGTSAIVATILTRAMMSESLAIAAEPATTPAVVAIIESHAAMMRCQYAAESLKPRLLLVGEALIERGTGVGYLL
jgi:hypothetical protein